MWFHHSTETRYRSFILFSRSQTVQPITGGPCWVVSVHLIGSLYMFQRGREKSDARLMGRSFVHSEIRSQTSESKSSGTPTRCAFGGFRTPTEGRVRLGTIGALARGPQYASARYDDDSDLITAKAWCYKSASGDGNLWTFQPWPQGFWMLWYVVIFFATLEKGDTFAWCVVDRHAHRTTLTAHARR